MTQACDNVSAYKLVAAVSRQTNRRPAVDAERDIQTCARVNCDCVAHPLSLGLYCKTVQNLKSQLIQRVQSVPSEGQSTNEDDSATSNKLQRTMSEKVATRVRLVELQCCS